MKLLPAIDLMGGKCVRLYKGSYDEVTTYQADAVEVAIGFEKSGSEWIHIVDLDAARTGEPVNLATIATIADAVDIPLQVGGGVRSLERAQALRDLGVARVVIGTMTVEDPELVRSIAAQQPVALGLDVRGQEVAVHGWTEGSGFNLFDLLKIYSGSPGIEAVVITQISQDGTLEGADLEGLQEALVRSPFGVIASGGVGNLEHLRQLAALEHEGIKLAGAIVGKAIHDMEITVQDALEACRS